VSCCGGLFLTQSRASQTQTQGNQNNIIIVDNVARPSAAAPGGATSRENDEVAPPPAVSLSLYIHTYIHACIHTCIHTDRQTDIHTDIHPYIYYLSLWQKMSDTATHLNHYVVTAHAQTQLPTHSSHSTDSEHSRAVLVLPRGRVSFREHLP